MENISKACESAKTTFISYCDYTIDYTANNITEGNLGHHRGNVTMSLKALKTFSSDLAEEVDQEVLLRVNKILDHSIIFAQALDTENLKTELGNVNKNIRYIINLLAS